MRVLPSVVAPLVALAASAQPVLVDRIAAVVDGEPVFQSDVERRASRDDPDAKAPQQRLRALARARLDLIDAKLIAKDFRVTPTDAEIDAAIDGVAKGAKLDRAALEAAVTRHGMSLAEYREVLRSQLLELRWLMTRSKERSVSISSDAEREALRTSLVVELRKRAVIEVFE
ncbi:MAG: hypothetical protein JNJ54_29890 [Myxococcaceae bacterium]|nr:hypothetical protein [Myxococcaceae bacterium]